MLVKVGDFVRIRGKHAGNHRYNFAIGFGAEVLEFHHLIDVQYATVRLILEPPQGEPHMFLVPVIDLKTISKEQARFQLIESR